MSINLKTHEWAKQNHFSSYFFPETPSTNDYAKIEFQNSKSDFAIYLADHQTKGRGRYERSWQNMSDGEILLSTWCFQTNKAPQPIFPALVGLALYKSLQSLERNLKLHLKAPNDIFLNDGKLAGLLIEVSQQGHSFEIHIGLGLNVLGAPKLDTPTACLAHEFKITQAQWHAFCDSLLHNFQEALSKGQDARLSDQDREALRMAINHGLKKEEQIQEVTPTCDLISSAGQTHWKDL